MTDEQELIIPDTELPPREQFPAIITEVRGDYVDNDGNPISLYDVMVMQSKGESQIGDTYLTTETVEIRVSTVNLHHCFRMLGSNRKHFETMVFVEKGSHPLDEYTAKYGTVDDAARGHWSVVDAVSQTFHKADKSYPDITHVKEPRIVVDAPDLLDRRAIGESGSTERTEGEGRA